MGDQACCLDCRLDFGINIVGAKDLCLAIFGEVSADDIVTASVFVTDDMMNSSGECSNRTSVGMKGILMDGAASRTILLVVDSHSCRMGRV